MNTAHSFVYISMVLSQSSLSMASSVSGSTCGQHVCDPLGAPTEYVPAFVRASCY